jgi:excisionase family DNA binding protein
VARTDIEPLMTPAAVCSLLGISKQTLYRIIQRGELTPVRVSRSPRFTAEAVRQYIDRNREAAS